MSFLIFKNAVININDISSIVPNEVAANHFKIYFMSGQPRLFITDEEMEKVKVICGANSASRIAELEQENKILRTHISLMPGGEEYLARQAEYALLEKEQTK